ncbi:MAG: hypothetical protein IKX47_06105, partial [Oscillospiraceae bacterium]|nr:hypothetical protein [Oscillospiraceae bacterium]
MNDLIRREAVEMPEMKQPDENRLFISERLNKLLQRIPRCSLTVLEAPAGYGKTTAVHYALDEAENQAFWYTAVESAPDNSFRW